MEGGGILVGMEGRGCGADCEERRVRRWRIIEG